MGARILSIAPEVLEMIGNMSDLEDIKNLRLCCKQLGQFLEKSILETISYNINVLNASTSITKLQCLGSGASPGASRTNDTECYIDGKLAQVPKPPDDAQLLSIEQETKKYLLPALTALENVNSVSWRVLYQDNEWAQRAAMQAILSFKHLRSLRLEFNTVAFGLPLHHLRGIEEISIVANDAKDTSGHRAQIWSNLPEMLSLNTHLTSLTVQVGNYMARSTPIDNSLHYLFGSLRAGTPLVHLHRLSLEGINVKLDENTLPQLRSLTALQLMLPEHVYWNDGGMGRFEDDFDLPEDIRMVCSTSEEIWGSIKRDGLQLQEIEVWEVGGQFYDYLKSFSGLRKLTITPSRFRSAIESDESARQFFGSPFRKHVESLEELHILASYEGLWCFGDHNASILSRCKNLKVLGISVLSHNFTDDPQVDGERKEKKKEDIVTIIMEMVSCSLPLLQKLELYSASLEIFRDDWCGTSMMEHQIWVTQCIAQSLSHYSATLTCLHLPNSVEIGDVDSEIGDEDSFALTRKGIDMAAGEIGGWHYVAVPKDKKINGLERET